MFKKFIKHRAVLFIIAIWIIFCSPYFFKGRVPFPSTYQVTFFPPWSAIYGMPVKNNAMPDVITQMYPWKTLTIESWRMGQVPLWNPYSFAGTPQAANYQSAVFSPFNLLFFILAAVDAWTILILLQPLLAGLFMYLFLGTLIKDPRAKLIGSIAFMFCGFLVVWMAYGTLGYAALFLPLILWGVRKKNGLVITLGVALSFLSGHFQISLYVLGLSIAWLVFQKGSYKSWLFLLLGLFIASPQLLLSYDAYRLSVRSEIFKAGEIIPWQYLTTLLAPDFYGNPVTRNDWFGHYAEWASFIGIVPFLLGLWALVSNRKKEVLFFGGIALISLLLATPTPLVTLLYWAKIPVLSTSAASRIIILFSFSFSVLSAFGCESLVKQWENGSMRRMAWFAGSILGVVALIWVALLFGHVLPAMLAQALQAGLPIDKLAIAKRNFLLPTGFVLATCVVFVCGFAKKKWLTTLLLAVLMVMTSVDSLRFAMKWMPNDPKALVFPDMKIIDALQQTVGTSHVVGNFGGELAVPFHVPSLEGYDALYPARYGELLMSANTGEVKSPERSVVKVYAHGVYGEKLLALTGVKYVLHRKSDGRFSWAYPVWEYPYYKRVYEDEYYELYENGNARPRAFLVSSYTVVADPAAIAQTLWSDGFDLGNSVVLEKTPVFEPAAGEGSAEISFYSPNRVSIKTVSRAPKLLFLSDAYDEGWHAKVDGAPSKVYRADYAFRAVAVPAGEHTVTMVYEPRGWLVGKYLAGAALAILILLGVKSRYETRHL